MPNWPRLPTTRRKPQGSQVRAPPATRQKKAFAPIPFSARDVPALAAMTIAGVALVGWVADLPILIRLLSSESVMKANTAVGIVLLGGACLLARRRMPTTDVARLASAALAVGVLALAGATAFEYLSGVSLDIDQLLAVDTSGTEGMPGRMAVNSLVSLVLIGGALLALDWAPHGWRPAEWLGISVAVVAVLALIGVAFGFEQFAGPAGDAATMAPNTAAALLLLACAIVTVRPEHLIFQALSGHDSGSAFLRRFALFAIATPFVFGVIVVTAVRSGGFTLEFGLSLATFLGMGVALAAVLTTAAYVRRAELEGMARREAGQFKALVETAYEGVWTTDEQGLTSFMNQRMLEMLGYDASEVLGKPALPLADPTYRLRADARMKDRFSGVRETYEGAFLRKDGSTLWALVSASPNFDPDGRPIGSLAMITDITSRRAADEVLRISELRFRALFDHAGVGIAVIDPSERLSEGNAALHEMLGYPVGELSGRLFQVLTGPDNRGDSDPLFTEMMSGGYAYTRRTRYRRKDGADLEVQAVVTRIEDSGGGWLALAVIQDLTTVVRGEQAMRESDRKSRFLATMSHELRTPLNAILGFAQLLQMRGGDPLSNRQRRYIENMRLSGQHLLGLVSDVLDLSKAATGTLTLGAEEVNVGDLVKECLTQLEPLAAASAIELRVDVEPSLAVRADPLRFRQALLNLLSNAVKFTKAGSVTVHAFREGEFTAISVSDTGIGILPAQLQDVFEEFFQVQDGSTRSADGAGLGLPLSRRLVELMGGRIDAESEPGVGSRFTLWLRSA